MDEQKQGEVRAELVAKEAELVRQRETLTRPYADQGTISFGKRVGDGTAMAVDRLSAVTAHDALGAALGEVHRAIVKLDEGSYGRCDACSSDIGAGRLEARPWSTHCVRHG
ncbi:MAG TPA: TraR/DksA C4-type zinc finger protein [Ornithinimicrobium sp.]|uniref:TraR/DksA family transcriptional regulator n=1 Tax=Ornithinimicrobium sp. TaxID=1977084 RepID=UPI002B483E42|nr:TraR/DksA C4-type zinc finger protein [Ornithinimicrobium sp.]HKJ11103.1 TraR/DksA C4-type zinc finger protein [Ornithinimicrobium sp.]